MRKGGKRPGGGFAPRGRGNRRAKEETREQLLSAAEELFAEKGYRGSSVRDLAAAAGVTTGAFYSNFISKREIYIAIINRITDLIQGMVTEITREVIAVMKQRGEVRMEYEILRHSTRRLLDQSSRHNSLLHILQREGLGRDPEFQREMDRVWERFVEMAKRAMDIYIAAGFAKAYDTELMAQALVPMFIGLSLYDFRTRGRRRDEIVGLLAAIMNGGASQWVVWREMDAQAKS